MNFINNKRKLSFYLAMGFFLLLGFSLGIFLGDRYKIFDKIIFDKNSKPLPSQDQIYANQIFDIMKDVDFFIFETVEKWDDLLGSTIPGGEITYNQFIEEFAQAYLNGENLQEYKESKAYLNLIDTAQLIIDQGTIASSDLKKVNPPESIKDSHEDLSTCVENYIERKKLIKLFLEQNVFVEPPNTCISYFDSRDQIYEFIDIHKLKPMSF